MGWNCSASKLLRSKVQGLKLHGMKCPDNQIFSKTIWKRTSEFILLSIWNKLWPSVGKQKRLHTLNILQDIDGESDTDIILDNVGEIAILTPSSSRPDLHSVQQSSFSQNDNSVDVQATMVKIAAPPTSTSSPKRGRVTPPMDAQHASGPGGEDDANIEVTLEIWATGKFYLQKSNCIWIAMNSLFLTKESHILAFTRILLT